MKQLIFISAFLFSMNLSAAGMKEAAKGVKIVQDSKIMNGDEFQNMEMISKYTIRNEVNDTIANVSVHRIYEVQGKTCNVDVKIKTKFKTSNNKLIAGSKSISGEITGISCVK